MHQLKLLLKFIKVYWQVESQYRLGAFLWIVNGTIAPLILMGVWLVVSQSRALTLNSHQIITYFVLVTIITRLTQTWTAEKLTDSIKTGKFANYLVKPYSFVLDRLAVDQALRVIRLLSLMPFIILVIILIQGNLILSQSPLIWLLFFISAVIGYMVNITLDIAVSLLTIWLEDAYGTFLLMGLFGDLLNGALIPLALMPLWLRNGALLLPFYPIIGLPIDIIMGNLSLSIILHQLLIASIWLMLLLALLRAEYHFFMKRFVAVGT